MLLKPHRILLLDELQQATNRFYEVVEKNSTAGYQQQAEISGSKAVLAGAVAQMKTGTSLEVPAFVSAWLPDLGSNHGPTD